MDDTSTKPIAGPGSASAAQPKPVRPARGLGGRYPRAVPLAGALALTALLTAGCSGGSSSAAGSSGAGQSRVQHALAFARCMRAHGALNFPDPDSAGGFVVTQANSATFQGASSSARAACIHLYPNEGKTAATPAQQEQQLRRSLAFAACMRRHGLPQFPGDWSGNVGQLTSAGIDPNSPQVTAALTACGF